MRDLKPQHLRQLIICALISPLYMVKSISVRTMCLSRYIMPIIFKNLEAILFMCEYHFKCLCIVNPKKLNSSADSILIFSISILGIFICF